MIKLKYLDWTRQRLVSQGTKIASHSYLVCLSHLRAAAGWGGGCILINCQKESVEKERFDKIPIVKSHVDNFCQKLQTGETFEITNFCLTLANFIE